MLLSVSLPSVLCSAQPGAKVSSGLGCREQGHRLCPRTDRQEWRGDLCPHGKRGIALRATSSVPVYGQAAAPISG